LNQPTINKKKRYKPPSTISADGRLGLDLIIGVEKLRSLEVYELS
jgi:hypothetical protein